jgi:phage repressor protein C with HTH and peptisase S24 domain
MHPTTERLYAAAKIRHDLDGQSAVARALSSAGDETTPQTVKNWETRGVSRKGMLDAERCLNISATWIQTGAGEMFVGYSSDSATTLQRKYLPAMEPFVTYEANSSETLVTIPRMNIAGVIGKDSGTREGGVIIEVMVISKTWLDIHIPSLTSISSLVIINGQGDAMSPTFSDGDILLVDSGVRVVDLDSIYVMSSNQRIYIKRVRQRMDGKYEVSSDNPNAKTVEVINGGNDVHIHGRVVWAWNGKRL